MQKNNTSGFGTRLVVIMGLLIAMEIILERIIAIPVGNITRFSIGKTIVIMSGIWLGPIPGAIVGAVSDVLGGILQGYGLSINPLITLSSMMWGIIPAIIMPRIKGSKTTKTVALCVSIFVNSIVSTLCLTTLGLVVVYGYNFFALLPTRLIQFAALAPTYCVVCVILYFSPVTSIISNMSLSKETA